MIAVPLTKSQAAILIEATTREDRQLILPPTMKPVTARRWIANLLRYRLITTVEQDGAAQHRLTTAGCRIVGRKPPKGLRGRCVRTVAPKDFTLDVSIVAGKPPAEAVAPVSKRDLVIALLQRDDGASLGEVIAATGWLPHTTRAALSRLRTGGMCGDQGRSRGRRRRLSHRLRGTDSSHADGAAADRRIAERGFGVRRRPTCSK